jgi:hypothetical protein
VALVGAVSQQPHQVRRVHPAQEVHLQTVTGYYSDA